MFGMKARKEYQGHVLITTTPTIEGHEIVEYIDIISVAVVQGTGPVAEWFNKATDMFGGRSGTFEDKLDAVIDGGKQMLEEKSRRLAPDTPYSLAVVAVDVDIMTFQRNQIAIVMGGTLVAYRKARADRPMVESPTVAQAMPAPAAHAPAAPMASNEEPEIPPDVASMIERNPVAEILRKTQPSPALKPLDGGRETLTIDPDEATDMVTADEVDRMMYGRHGDNETETKSAGRESPTRRNDKPRRRRKKKGLSDAERKRREEAARAEIESQMRRRAPESGVAAGVVSSNSRRPSRRTPEELMEMAAKANKQQAASQDGGKRGGSAKKTRRPTHDAPDHHHKQQKRREPKKPPSMVDESVVKVDEQHAPVGIANVPTDRPQTDLDAPQ